MLFFYTSKKDSVINTNEIGETHVHRKCAWASLHTIVNTRFLTFIFYFKKIKKK